MASATRVLRVSGQNAAAALLTRDGRAIPPNRAAYALLRSDAGGILDDLFVYRETR